MVDKGAERVRGMFAQIAPYYDRMNHVLSLNIDKRWRAATVRRMADAATDSLLDVCTGTGDLATAFAAGTPCRRIVGVDFCLPMLQIAVDKQRKIGIDPQRLAFMEADAQSLPFADDTFDAVTVAFGLRNVSDTMQGLREMLRVCRPGGQIGVLEFSKPTAPGFKQLYSFYFRRVLPRVGQTLARNQSEAYAYLPASVGEFPSGDDFLQLMRTAGYREPRQHAFTLGIASLYVGGKP